MEKINLDLRGFTIGDLNKSKVEEIRFELKGNDLSVTSDITRTQWVHSRGVDFDFSIKAELFKNILRRFKNTCYLLVVDNTISFFDSDTSFNVNLELVDVEYTTLDTKEFTKLAKYVLTTTKAKFKDGMPFYFKHILFRNKERLEVISCDGHRLSYTSRDWVNNFVESIVSVDDMNMILNLIKGTKEFELRLDGEELLAKVDNITYKSKLGDFQYAKVDGVMGHDKDYKAIVDKNQLSRGISTVSKYDIFYPKDCSVRTALLNFNSNSVIFRNIKSSQIDERKEDLVEVQVDLVNQGVIESHELRLDAKYVLDSLKVYNESDVELRFNKQASGVAFLLSNGDYQLIMERLV